MAGGSCICFRSLARFPGSHAPRRLDENQVWSHERQHDEVREIVERIPPSREFSRSRFRLSCISHPAQAPVQTGTTCHVFVREEICGCRKDSEKDGGERLD